MMRLLLIALGLGLMALTVFVWVLWGLVMLFGFGVGWH